MYPTVPLDPAQLAAFQQWQQQQLRPQLPAYAAPSPYPPAPYAQALPPPLPAQPPPLPRQRRQRATAAPEEAGASLAVIFGCLVIGAAIGATCQKHFSAAAAAAPAPAVAAAASLVPTPRPCP